MKFSRRTVIGILLIAGIIGAAGMFLLSERSSTSAPSLSANALYTTQFVDLENKPVMIGRWQGKILLINFWASWCGPCKTEIPHLIDAQKSFAGKNVQVLGIAVDSLQNAKDFSGRLGINYPILVNQDGAIALSQKLGNVLGVLPFTVLIDQNGNVKAVEVGMLNESKINKLVDMLL